MFSKDKHTATKAIPANILLTVERQSPVFYRINIEYFALYHGVKQDTSKQAIYHGLTNNLIDPNLDLRHKADPWKIEHEKALVALASKLTLEMERHNKQLPTDALQRLSVNIEDLKKSLNKAPNDYLSHFHLAWIYANAKNYSLAGRHFNVAALQSQTVNPQFASFAYRHLAQASVKNGKTRHALLAIESACSLSVTYHSELQFERIRLLSKAKKTTQALSHLVTLIKKSPEYAIVASWDRDLLSNPSLKHFFHREKENHIRNIRKRVENRWKNDPLRLLNLDKELGQKDSLKTLHSKQNELLLRLPSLLTFQEGLSSQLVLRSSRSAIVRSLNSRRQHFIKGIERQQQRASKIHKAGQWMLYASIISLISLGLSYAVSSISHQLNYYVPVNLNIQTILLTAVVGLVILGTTLLHFTPKKLNDLLKRKKRLDDISTHLKTSFR